MLDTSNCQEYYDEVRSFAESRGILDNLQKNLDYLDNYANGPGCLYDRKKGKDTRCVLGKDFAPHSFRIIMFCRESSNAEWKMWFHGGLIYHGPDAPGDGGPPSFSVSLSDSKEPRWQLHT